MRNKLWFGVDCRVHTNQKVVDFAGDLGLDIDTAVGKLARLWAWAKMGESEDGSLGRIPAEELATIMAWRKGPARLLRALVNSGLLDLSDDGSLSIHGWYEINGKSTEKARKDRARKQ